MHPDLQPVSLNKLSAPMRVIANKMLATPPSMETIDQYNKALIQIQNPSSEIYGFYHIFYVSLDPARIPSPTFDRFNVGIVAPLMAGIISLQRLVTTRPNNQVFPDLWPRIAAWSHYLCKHEKSIHKKISLGSLNRWFVGLLDFCLWMSDEIPTNTSLITSSPLSPIIAAHAWKCCFSQPTEFRQRDRALRMIKTILINSSSPLNEILAGSSLTLADLAGIIMQQCEVAIPRTTSGDRWLDLELLDHIWHLDMALDVVVFFDGIVGRRQKSIPDYPLCGALLPVGFVTTVAIAIRTLSSADPSDDEYNRILNNSLVLLCSLAGQQRGDQVLQTALEHGLLRALIALSKRDQLGEIAGILLRLVLEFMIPSTVYYYFLKALEAAYTEAADSLAHGTHFPSHPDLARAWDRFLVTMGTRLDLRIEFDSDSGPSRGVCGNAKCGQIAARKDLNACKGCSEVLYCSRECQKVDWRARHRASCAKERDSHSKARIIYTAKERTFLRFLLHQEYLKHKFQIALDHTTGWAANRNAILFTLYDFTTFPVQVETYQASDDIIKGVFRGVGFMDMQMMHLREGAGDRKWMFKLARENSEVPDALKDVAVRLDSLSQNQIRIYVAQSLQREGMVAITADI
ncbi:hypothetical protein R3P38DRAFT_3042288 [Favolaschia claudopus]|uniref:MYND-type domain-containing protein n=1 Tax=Favolaschia claudopus TaxID=2862362 RepID=A0AAW0A7M9_9AGAR